jgi:hypothetical protein
MNEPQPRMYRPAWLMRLSVRLEDFGQADDSRAQDGQKPYRTAKQQQAADRAIIEAKLAQRTAYAATGSRDRSALVGLRAVAASLNRQAKQVGSPSSAGDNGKPDEFSIEFFTVPMEMTIEDKGFREADTLEATFPLQDMPLNPYIMRECRVDVWVGTVRTEDFATPDKWHLEPRISQTSVLRFRGYIDMPEMEHDDVNVHIKARSYISTLIDGKITALAKPYRVQNTEEYLTTYINRILSLYPPTAGGNGGSPFRAYWYASPSLEEPKISAKDLVRSLQTAASRNAASDQPKDSDVNAQVEPTNEATDLGGQKDGPATGVPGLPPRSVTEDGMSIWDLITQACELCGVMPLYKPCLPEAQGSQAGKAVPVDPANCLLITPPEAFVEGDDTNTQLAGGARDGFKREFSGGIKSNVRFMVWGHNLSKLKISRKMGKVRPTAVEVRSRNPDASAHLRVVSARFPKHNPKAKKGGGKTGSANKMTERGGGKIDVVRTFIVKGVRNVQQLERIAVSLYQQLCRSELTMQLETDELASYIDPVASQSSGTLETHNDNPDLLRLCAGSPVHVTVAKKSTEEANLTICGISEFYDLSVDNILDVLTKQNERWGAFRTDGSMDTGKISETARKIQAAYRAAKLPTVFYCKGIRLQFSAADTFFHATMELCNYMPSNDPANMSATDQKLNDQRKLKKVNPASRKQAAEDGRTDQVVDRAARKSAGVH